MWWVLRKNGRRDEGPYDENDIKRRLENGALGRYDRISQDRRTWVYVKDTPLCGLIAPSASSRKRAGRVTPVPLVRPERFSPVPPDPDEGQSASADSRPYIPERHRVPEGVAPRPFVAWPVLCGILGCAVVGLLVMFLVQQRPAGRNASPGTASRPEATPVPTNAAASSAAETNDIRFVDVKDKVVVIGNEGHGGGSAFLLRDGGRVWLVSNEHVTRCGEEDFRHVLLLDGLELELGRFEVAADRDIARFEVLNASSAFTLSSDVPNVGDRLSIYGNSLGGGAITELKGKVKSIGPLRVEVDTEAVPGNSGSAVLDGRGHVIGIFTYVRNEKVDENDKKNWDTKGTQFDAVRRFAVRFTNVSWEPIDWKAYLHAGWKARDLVNYLFRLFPLLDADDRHFDLKDYAFKQLLYESVTGNIFKQSDSYEERLVELSALYVKWSQTEAHFRKIPDEAEREDEKMHWALKSLEARKVYCQEKRKALRFALEKLKEEKWPAHVAHEMVVNGFPGVDYYEARVKRCLENENRTIRDIDKTLKEARP